MTRQLKVIILVVIFTVLTANPARALMADVFEVSSEAMSTQKILKGDVFSQSFVSQSNDFGIVGVRFSNNKRINDDYLFFRIKEVGSRSWYYENQYKVDQFQDGQFFIFGFPKISEAKEKTFIFELESANGSEDNSVSVYLTRGDEYNEGQAFKNNENLEKDLSFKIVKEAPAGEMIKKDFTEKLKQDPIFFSFWGLFSLSVLGLLLKK